MERLRDRVALITGAGSGIGAAVARTFVREGARVVAFDVSAERLAALAAGQGASVATVCGDVRSAADNAAAVQTALERFGALDTLVANAGIWDAKRRLDELSDDAFAAGYAEVFDVNVRGFFLSARAAIPALKQARGSIVFTLSSSSFYLGGGGPIYVAAKHATLGLMKALAHELAPDVRVNGVAPSYAPTALTSAAALVKPSQSAAAGRAPDGRLTNLLRVDVEPDDHAGAYAFFASEEARLITGAVINSDGGRGVMGPQQLV